MLLDLILSLLKTLKKKKSFSTGLDPVPGPSSPLPGRLIAPERGPGVTQSPAGDPRVPAAALRGAHGSAVGGNPGAPGEFEACSPLAEPLRSVSCVFRTLGEHPLTGQSLAGTVLALWSSPQPGAVTGAELTRVKAALETTSEGNNSGLSIHVSIHTYTNPLYLFGSVVLSSFLAHTPLCIISRIASSSKYRERF